ncbi:hypothetical protein PNEG_01879 [Pneumocystis murina B123]|uniref:CCHC-type domain-containing protein n=1 Tax=Pneumocystis murina (strain B123) TaxID=1069680 RepID=M7NR12_PNEMU|nr:hypothetical protein PNEG_01879 [Pneumocystis murina B123]EMR09692.1 hypothetical protein PNEG_01879 [Pneumocystis murina B123]
MSNCFKTSKIEQDELRDNKGDLSKLSFDNCDWKFNGDLLNAFEGKKSEEKEKNEAFVHDEEPVCKNELNLGSLGLKNQEITENENLEDLKSDIYEESENTDTIEDWAQLSKGRYFGLAQDEIICHKCAEPGHIARDCFQEMCTNCGTVNDHLASRCPMLQKCHNCNELGHILIDCKKPRKINICSTCSSKYHPDDMCPKIWRCYTFNPDAPKEFTPKRYCYNCAEYGHYGDDCRLPQYSRYLESSAFCIDNEPIPASEYEYIKHREIIKKKKLLKTYREYEKEDWFARKMKKKCLDHKSPKLDTFRSNKSYNKINYLNGVHNRRDELLYNNSDKQQNNKYDKKRLKRNLNKGKSIFIDLIPH